MHYSYSITVAPSNTITAPAIKPVLLGAGIIKHVSILFPSGCARTVYVVFADTAYQLLPSNTDSQYCEDGYSVEADCYIDMKQRGNLFFIYGWTSGSSYNHTIHVLIDVQGVDEPTPDQSVLVLAGAIDNLVMLMRSWS